VLPKTHSPIFHKELIEDYYETTPSQKPAQQRRSIELQPSSTHNLKINKNTQMRKKNKERRTFSVYNYS
jgi:hypothetical protein